jgi:YebC/PmpR family DNA-binding regulatory protein
MIQKARDNSLPVDTIQRAIKRGTGEEEGVIYEQVSYEGYAASGVAVIVQALTDNRNRTSAEIKNIFSRNGGSFAEPGAVSWQFERQGVMLVDRSADEDELTLAAADAGAEDVQDLGDSWQVTTPPTELHAARTAIEEAGFKVKSSDLTLIPTTSVALDAEDKAKSVLRLMDALEEHDDVEAVYANFDIPDAVLEAVSA